jgi:hypothetical protein
MVTMYQNNVNATSRCNMTLDYVLSCCSYETFKASHKVANW